MLTAHDFLYTGLVEPPHWATVQHSGGTQWDGCTSRSVRTIFPLCWVSWAWAEGVSRRALLFLLLIIFALNWEIMLKLKSTCLLLYATCQMFQHILYVGHFMVTEELVEPKLDGFGLQNVIWDFLWRVWMIDWVYFRSQNIHICLRLPSYKWVNKLIKAQKSVLKKFLLFFFKVFEKKKCVVCRH